MVQLWSCLLLVLASLCAVHTKTYPEAKNTDGLRTGYHHFPGVGYYRIAYQTPENWAEARRKCQNEGGTLAVVNSEEEAEALRIVYFDYGPATPEHANGTVHIGLHDRFMEGEYLTFYGEPLFMTGFIRWLPGHPIADDYHNCLAFHTEKFLLDIPCDQELPYICEIPEEP